MLDHLKQRIADTLAETRLVTLATDAEGDVLFALVPRTSDHLLNIESNPSVVVTTVDWQLRGAAEILPICPERLALAQRQDAPWCSVVRIAPRRLHIAPVDLLRCAETIDVI
jgi:hypothetical protein